MPAYVEYSVAHVPQDACRSNQTEKHRRKYVRGYVLGNTPLPALSLASHIDDALS